MTVEVGQENDLNIKGLRDALRKLREQFCKPAPLSWASQACWAGRHITLANLMAAEAPANA